LLCQNYTLKELKKSCKKKKKKKKNTEKSLNSLGLVTILVVVDVAVAMGFFWVVMGFCCAACILARAGAGAGSAGRSMSPQPSFSSSSFGEACSCASPHPSVDVGDDAAGSSAWKRGWALVCVAIDGGALTPWGTEAAVQRHQMWDLNCMIAKRNKVTTSCNTFDFSFKCKPLVKIFSKQAFTQYQYWVSELINLCKTLSSWNILAVKKENTTKRRFNC
jgi:hypothetical protein